MAWLSNTAILNALKRYARGVFFIVNDEDFDEWGNGDMYSSYATLPKIEVPIPPCFPFSMDKFDIPVRALKKSGALMHSKYLVFFSNALTPSAVWTGSMNYTAHSTRNQENAVLIESEAISMFYFQDFIRALNDSTPIRVDPPLVLPLRQNLGLRQHLINTVQAKKLHVELKKKRKNINKNIRK